jgi:serine/threonine protein kinase
VPQESQLTSLLDVAQGMAYLHGSSIVHGDLKAANVCYVKPPSHNSTSSSSNSSRLVCKVGLSRVGWSWVGSSAI